LEHRIGSLEPGKAADFIALDGRQVESLAVGDPHTRILYYGSPALVRRVYVDGRLICADGELQSVDEHELRTDFRQRMLAAWERERRSG
jgi:cytosine/adenosine deaminase-related metal-dependent hydrolase